MNHPGHYLLINPLNGSSIPEPSEPLNTTLVQPTPTSTANGLTFKLLSSSVEISPSPIIATNQTTVESIIPFSTKTSGNTVLDSTNYLLPTNSPSVMFTSMPSNSYFINPTSTLQLVDLQNSSFTSESYRSEVSTNDFSVMDSATNLLLPNTDIAEEQNSTNKVQKEHLTDTLCLSSNSEHNVINSEKKLQSSESSKVLLNSMKTEVDENNSNKLNYERKEQLSESSTALNIPINSEADVNDSDVLNSENGIQLAKSSTFLRTAINNETGESNSDVLNSEKNLQLDKSSTVMLTSKKTKVYVNNLDLANSANHPQMANSVGASCISILRQANVNKSENNLPLPYSYNASNSLLQTGANIECSKLLNSANPPQMTNLFGTSRISVLRKPSVNNLQLHDLSNSSNTSIRTGPNIDCLKLSHAVNCPQTTNSYGASCISILRPTNVNNSKNNLQLPHSSNASNILLQTGANVHGSKLLNSANHPKTTNSFQSSHVSVLRQASVNNLLLLPDLSTPSYTLMQTGANIDSLNLLNSVYNPQTENSYGASCISVLHQANVNNSSNNLPVPDSSNAANTSIQPGADISSLKLLNSAYYPQTIHSFGDSHNSVLHQASENNLEPDSPNALMHTRVNIDNSKLINSANHTQTETSNGASYISILRKANVNNSANNLPLTDSSGASNASIQTGANIDSSKLLNSANHPEAENSYSTSKISVLHQANINNLPPAISADASNTPVHLGVNINSLKLQNSASILQLTNSIDKFTSIKPEANASNSCVFNSVLNLQNYSKQTQLSDSLDTSVTSGKSEENANKLDVLNSEQQIQLSSSLDASCTSAKVNNSDDVVVYLPLDIYKKFQGDTVVDLDYALSNMQNSVSFMTSAEHQHVLELSAKSDHVSETSPNLPTLEELLSPLYKYIKDDVCLLCGFKSKSKGKGPSGIKRHLVTHLTARIFKCDQCEKSFTTPDNLILHRTTHSEEFPFSCDICNKKFRVKGYLRSHMKTHMINTKKHTCTFCGREFSNMDSLREHQRIHTNEQPYICSICSATFRTRGMLKNHSNHHYDEKLYSCSICGKGYNSKGNLSDHMHSHEKNPSHYKCHLCGKTFSFKSNLCQHMVMHSDARTHACHLCDQKFKLPHHLRAHILTHNRS